MHDGMPVYKSSVVRIEGRERRKGEEGRGQIGKIQLRRSVAEPCGGAEAAAAWCGDEKVCYNIAGVVCAIRGRKEVQLLQETKAMEAEVDKR